MTFITNGTVGLFKNKPIFEVATGIGYKIGPRKQSIIFVTYNNIYQFDEETDRNRRATLIEFGWFLKYLSFKFAFPLERNNSLIPNIDTRGGIVFYPYKNFSIGGQLYRDYSSGQAFPGISIGFGI